MRFNHLLEALIVVVGFAYVLLSPFVKVEESFSLHFIKDVLLFSNDVTTFDHVTFAGAVPRSFLAPLVLAIATSPFLSLGRQLGLLHDELSVQVLTRCILVALSSASLIFLFRRVKDSFGQPVATLTMLFTLSQFHLLYYLGRTLPNMLAFPLVQVVLAMFIAPWTLRTKKGKGSNIELLEGFAVLTFTAIVMRIELLALLLPLAYECWSKKLTYLKEMIIVGGIASIAGLCVTVGLDSFLWNRLVWPEGEATLFNVIQGHAADWGVSPWHYYFTNSLPKIFNFSLPLIVCALFIDRRVRSLAFVSISFIGLLSILGHKEWRFFVYVIPSLNVCAAAAVQSLELLFSRRRKFIAATLIIGTNLLLTSLVLFASIHNYPGGQAMSQLATILSSSSHSTPISVHIDSHSAMTGASKFSHPWESPSPWYISRSPSSPSVTYNRSESLSLLDYNAFDYLVSGSPLIHREFEIVRTISEFEKYQLNLKMNGGLPVQVKWRESVWVLKKKGKAQY